VLNKEKKGSNAAAKEKLLQSAEAGGGRRKVHIISVTYRREEGEKTNNLNTFLSRGRGKGPL